MSEVEEHELPELENPVDQEWKQDNMYTAVFPTGDMLSITRTSNRWTFTCRTEKTEQQIWEALEQELHLARENRGDETVYYGPLEDQRVSVAGENCSRRSFCAQANEPGFPLEAYRALQGDSVDEDVYRDLERIAESIPPCEKASG